MKLGIHLPTFGPLAEDIGISAMARAAEAGGADGVWFADHILLVGGDTRDWPWTEDRKLPWDLKTPIFETLVSMAFAAAVTSRVRIGTAVLIATQRNPLELAKAAATLDRLSGGRVELGIGSGWFRSEIEALGYSFEERGKRMDELVHVLRDAWTGQPAAFDGEQVKVREHLAFYPTPIQEGGPPILFGGDSPPALRRATRVGDGWIGAGFAETLSDDVDFLRGQLDKVLALRAAAGADGAFRTSLNLNNPPPPGKTLADLALEVEAIGFDEVILDPDWSLGVDVIEAEIREAREALSNSTVAGGGL